MKYKKLLLPLFMLLIFAITSTAAAQDDAVLEIRLRRDFGYGGFGNDIQGTFSILASGPEDLVEVQFYIDDEIIGKKTEAPFNLKFNTDNFDPGIHTIYAIGILADGSEIRSNERVQEFLSNDSALGKTMNLVVPILVITIGGTVLGAVLPMLRQRKKGGLQAIGEYGAAGGTVCPRCGFPFSRNFLSPNLAVGKLEHCPHCGKWSIRPRTSQAELAAAEERLRASRQESSGEIVVDEKDELKRALEDSRFDD